MGLKRYLKTMIVRAIEHIEDPYAHEDHVLALEHEADEANAKIRELQARCDSLTRQLQQERMGSLESMTEWTDIDMACASLATAIGILKYPSSKPGQDPWDGHKWIFWTNNPLGNGLYEILHRLVDLGVLDYRDDPDTQLRWSPTFSVDPPSPFE